MIYSIIFWTLNHEINKTKWLWFGTSVFYFFMVLWSFFLSGRRTQSDLRQNRRFILSIFFCIFHMIFSLVQGKREYLPFRKSMAICVCMSSLYLFFWMTLKNQSKGLCTVQSPTAESDGFLEDVRGQLSVIIIGIEDIKLKDAIKHLEEDILYSEPGKKGRTQELEERIRGNIIMLRESLEDHNIEKAFDHITKLKQLIAERNVKLRAGNK